MKRLFTWMAFLIVNASLFGASEDLWNGSQVGQLWSNAANWTVISGTAPPGAGDTADFHSGNATVNIDGAGDSITVVNFQTGAQAFTFNPSGNVLTFTSPSPAINVHANSQTFNNDTDLSDNTTLTIASNASLTNNGTIESTSGSSGPFFNLIVSGGATSATFTNGFEITFLNTFQISDVDFVNNGFVGDNKTFQVSSGTVDNNLYILGGDLLPTVANTLQIDGGMVNNNFLIALFATGNFTGGTINNKNTFEDIFAFTQSGNSMFNNSAGSTVQGFNTYNLVDGTFNNDGSFFGHDAPLISTSNFVQTGGTFNNFIDGEISMWDLYSIAGGTTTNSGEFDTITTLSVSGTGLLVNNAAIGGGIGTFSVSGNGTYEPLVRDAANTATLNAGTLDLSGNLLVKIAPNFDDFNGTPVEILTGTVDGRFATVSTTNPALRARAIYNADSVDVVFGPAVPVGFVLPELRETIWASVNHANFRVERELVKVRQRMCSCGCPWNVYGGFIGSQGEFNPRRDDFGSGREFDYSSVGGLIGVDYTCRNWALGVQFNYDNIYDNNDNNHHRRGNFNIDFARGSFFATYVPECMSSLAVDLIVGGGGQWWDLHRNVFTGGLVAPLTAHGRVDVTEWDILGGLEYAYSCGCDSMVVPYGTVQYVRLDFDRFHERGAGFFGFDIHNRDIDSLRTVFGGRWLGNYSFCNISFQPEFDLAWEHEYYDDVQFFFEPIAVAGFGESFGPRRVIGRNFVLFAADFFFGFCGNWGLDVSYDLEWTHRFENHTYYVGGNYRF